MKGRGYTNQGATSRERKSPTFSAAFEQPMLESSTPNPARRTTIRQAIFLPKHCPLTSPRYCFAPTPGLPKWVLGSIYGTPRRPAAHHSLGLIRGARVVADCPQYHQNWLWIWHPGFSNTQK